MSAEERRGVVSYAGRVVATGLAALLVALLIFGLVSRAGDTTIDDALAEGRPVEAPGFELDVLTLGKLPPAVTAAVRRAAADGRINLVELRRTPVVVNFWASWCVPCREEAPLLQSSWTRRGKRGVLFLGLNMQDVRDDARGFLAEFGQTFPQIRDPDNSTARDWGVTGIPETFFLRRDGRVVSHVIGAISPRQLETGIAAAVSGKAIDARQGGDRRPTR